MPELSPIESMPLSDARDNPRAGRQPATPHGSCIGTRLARASGLLLAGALLVACAPEPDAAAPDAGSPPADEASGPAQDAAAATPAPEGGPGGEQDPATPAPPAPQPGGTVGGDGSEIRLDPLTAADIEQAALAGELACSFAADGAQAPLLLAMGVVASDDPAQGVVKVAGYVEPVRAPGGFDGMLEDPAFTGQGKTVRIALTGPATGGGESPPRPATLTYLRADGASRTFEGQWQCGP